MSGQVASSCCRGCGCPGCPDRVQRQPSVICGSRTGIPGHPGRCPGAVALQGAWELRHLYPFGQRCCWHGPGCGADRVPRGVDRPQRQRPRVILPTGTRWRRWPTGCPPTGWPACAMASWTAARPDGASTPRIPTRSGSVRMSRRPSSAPDFLAAQRQVDLARPAVFGHSEGGSRRCCSPPGSPVPRPGPRGRAARARPHAHARPARAARGRSRRSRVRPGRVWPPISAWRRIWKPEEGVRGVFARTVTRHFDRRYRTIHGAQFKGPPPLHDHRA
jgi:hypothetical protein